MTRLEHSTLIQRPISAVYPLCRQVERYPEFLPGYRESAIVGRAGDAFLLERAAQMGKKLYRWKSWVRFEENKALHFEHAEGPLRGMRVDWDFYSPSSESTRVVITHHFHIQRPWGFFIERFVFKPKINAIAGQVIAALKRECEDQKLEAVSV